ncbi:MAG: DEAD/DEAH box helicase family protein [Patescibacteria group bacterium]
MRNKIEAQARIKINKLLTESGWLLIDEGNNRANVTLETGVDIQTLGDDFENTSKGYIDYLLLDDKQFPLCVLEAKRESIHPLSAKEQARNYAKGHNCRYIILSNGVSHYLWDTLTGDPVQITEFPTQESLIHRQEYNPNTQDLVGETITPQYLGEVKTLRYYQIEAIEAIQNAAKNGKVRFLLEMATGTGKTTTAAAICKLFLKTGNAARILFLVDRIELEDQAVKALKEIFKDEYFIGTYKKGNWNKQHIVVSTIQSLLAGNRYRDEFKPIDFDLVISDEAHRSIGGNSRAVFEYFLGYKLGLTATPKNFIKGVDTQDENSNLEARKLRDTYKTFGCEGTDPTYKYDLKKGVSDNFLLNPFVLDARTEITTQLLSNEGYNVQVEDENGNNEDMNFGGRNFERTFFNEDTNRVFCETILSQGYTDPLTGEFGKTLVFCVSRAHAAKVTNLLNQLASTRYPSKYSSDFAMQVTSDVMNNQDYTKQFSANRLNGKSRFAQDAYPDYETGKSRVCVTVGMMTTGYDCPDLLNVVLMRPIFSPSDFVQMKGRGTRRHDFVYAENGEKASKEKFLLLDFFGNCVYFEKDFDYNAKLALNVSKSSSTLNKDPLIVDTTSTAPIDAGQADTIATETIIHIGKEGMKIDRELYPEKHQQFEFVIKNSAIIQQLNQEQDEFAVEEYIKVEVFNKPNEYWNADKIRQSYEKQHKTNRKISLIEMIQNALGITTRFKNREERIEEEFQKFIDIQKPQIQIHESAKAQLLKRYFETYVSDSEFRLNANNYEYARMDNYFTGPELQLLNGSLQDVPLYAKEYLNKEINEFDWKTK